MSECWGESEEEAELKIGEVNNKTKFPEAASSHFSWKTCWNVSGPTLSPVNIVCICVIYDS